MKRRLCMVRGVLSLLACFAGTLAGAQEAATAASSPAEAPAQQPAAPATTAVILTTSLGEIHLALETTRAPVTAGNFLRYVDAKRFDGIDIYRAYKVTEDGKYDIVRSMLDLPRSTEARNPVMKGQMLGPPVKIITARRAP